MVGQSSLTARQLEALEGYVRVALGEVRYREAAAGGESGGVTVGSYFRTVQQARENVRQSLVTLLIGLWLGVVKTEDVRRLLELAVAGEKALSDEEVRRFVAVLNALLEKIVM